MPSRPRRRSSCSTRRPGPRRGLPPRVHAGPGGRARRHDPAIDWARGAPAGGSRTSRCSPGCSTRRAPSRDFGSASVRSGHPRCTAGTWGSRRSRTVPSPISRRPSPSPRGASGSAGSPATRRSATGWPRSWAPGWAIRSSSPCWNRARRWPTSAPSWCPTRRPRASRPSRPGAPGGPGCWWRRSRRSSRRPSPRPTCPRSFGFSVRARGSRSTRWWASCSTGATRRSSRWRDAASSPGGAASWTCSRPRRRSRSGSSSSATRSTACEPSTPPTSGAWRPCASWSCSPPRSSCSPTVAPTRSGHGLAGWLRGSRSASPSTSPGSPARRRSNGRPRRSPGARWRPAMRRRSGRG